MQNDHRPDATGSGRGGQVGELLAQALRSRIGAASGVSSTEVPADVATGGGAATGASSAGGADTGAATEASSAGGADTDGAPAVLDCGGGSGRFAVPLAGAGARVTVVDISIDALATLRRRAEEAGVADRVVAVQGDVESLADLVPAASFDLVLAHGILEVVEPLESTFAVIAAAVRPGGLLSVLVSNPVAAVLARALTGDLAGAERELAALGSERPSPLIVRQLCVKCGLVVEALHGIGVFRDLVPGAALDLPGGREALARLDDACAQRSPFAEIAGQVHLLARRPIG